MTSVAPPTFQPVLHGPLPPATVVDGKGETYLKHAITGKYLVATPEEWVRQNLLLHLIAVGYPPGLIATERQVRTGRVKRRFDVLVYDTATNPFLVAECKAPEIPLSQQTQHQAAAYNSVLGARFVLLTNGRSWELFECQEGFYHTRNALPPFAA